MKRFVAVIAIFKKWSLFKVGSKYKTLEGRGSEPMPTVTANTLERRHQENETCTTSAV